MGRICCLLFCLLPVLSEAQSADSAMIFPRRDSTLAEVSVTAFHSRQQWLTLPAAVNTIGQHEMNRYAPGSAVPVFNALPGVRMEERSPSSIRLSLRGSLLRSPFGVRNVKVYWNDIPFTDAGGNTYLQLADLREVSQVEILKGPAASSYGAGTGGAVLLNTLLQYSDNASHHFTAGISGGSYGSFGEDAGWTYSNRTFVSSVQQLHQQSDGYREQSASRKDALQWQMQWQTGRQQFRSWIVYTDLWYQTPGGITLQQWQQNPKLSRQPAGALPGAIQQQTAIFNKTILGALQHTVKLGQDISMQSFVMLNHTSFTNPFITNYEKRGEANGGAGTKIRVEKNFGASRLNWVSGFEWLQNHSLITNFGNRGGRADTLQFSDDIRVRQGFVFTQAEWVVRNRWNLSAGISLNHTIFHYRRTSDPASVWIDKKIDPVATPRIALLYRISKALSVYGVLAKGFSPPALAELRPSDGNYYGNLNAEYGWNTEFGIKGDAMQQRLQFDIAAYFFGLRNAIVRRNNAVGAEYFVNAGSTRQQGVELLLKYRLIRSGVNRITQLDVWSSFSYQPYRFLDYQQSGISYSGNALTGVPKTIWVSGLDMAFSKGLYTNISINATSSLPLTDANDVYAPAYALLQARMGWKSGMHFDFFVTGDNLLNQVYSLGNDINAAGRRYYNSAYGRNLQTGIRYRF
jgi:iron complex outermembrane receptor protein